jgi:BolA protein
MVSGARQGKQASSVDSPLREEKSSIMTTPARPVAASIAAKLEAAFEPVALDIVDQSHLHAGHAHTAALHADGRKGGETHFAVTIVSAKFDGQSRTQRQRLVYAALREELAGPVHALSLKTLSPGEFATDD